MLLKGYVVVKKDSVFYGNDQGGFNPEWVGRTPDDAAWNFALCSPAELNEDWQIIPYEIKLVLEDPTADTH